MKPATHRGLLGASALALAISLAGCGERGDDTTVGQKSEGAVSRTGQAARDARDSAKNGAVAARGKASESAQAAGAGTGSSTSVMGAAGEARDKAYGSGDPGKVDDAKLTTMVLSGLKADKELNPLRIDVDTREGVVTLSGSVPSAAAKARASEIAKNVKDVKSVNNQLTLTSG